MSIINYCQTCINYLGDGKCEAFDKIPLEIIRGEKDHSKPLPKQGNDIVFEKIKS